MITNRLAWRTATGESKDGSLSDKLARDKHNARVGGLMRYYLRFCDRARSSVVGEKRSATDGPRRQAGGVDCTSAGPSTLVLQLLYARFWHKVLWTLASLEAGAIPASGQPGITSGKTTENVEIRGNILHRTTVIDQMRGRIPSRDVYGPLEQMNRGSHARRQGVAVFSLASGVYA